MRVPNRDLNGESATATWKLWALSSWVAAMFAWYSAPPALAQSSGNYCVTEQVGGMPPCTANDVRVGTMTLISGPATCDPTDTTPFTVTLEALIESGPDRFDVGLWVNESGGSAHTDPGGTCYRDYLNPPLSATTCNQLTGDYYDGDGDQCGDVYASNTDPCGTAVTGPCSDGSGGTCLFTTKQFTVKIVCTDINGDGTADAGTCTSWDNNDNTVCNGHLDTDPGTGSKCSCDFVEISGLRTDPCVDVNCSPMNTDCAAFTCDSNAAEPNCDIVTYFPGTVCRPGSGDMCDPDEVCVDQQAECPADVITPATTVCNPGSGDICDPAESCPGTPGGTCPEDTVASATTICRYGSGDMCDPAESCPGEADMGCPEDVITPATTICNPGSGDICDPAESCPGIAGGTCPEDTVASATTICRYGSGDMCDPDESCPGKADMGCPEDVITPATTVCNPGSGDICDPAESCPGTAGGTCPEDTVASATTICRYGSGDMCDPDESCPGEADMGCPADVIAPSTTICNPGSGDMCDPDESCPGTPGGTCPG